MSNERVSQLRVDERLCAGVLARATAPCAAQAVTPGLQRLMIDDDLTYRYFLRTACTAIGPGRA